MPDEAEHSGVFGGIEECLEDAGGGDGVEVLFLLFSRNTEGGELFFSIETAEPFILEEEGQANDLSKFCGEITDSLCLRAFGAVHVER